MTEPKPIRVERYVIDGATVEIRTFFIAEAYPRNGNVGNPTRYHRWEAYDLDGNFIACSYSTRWECYEDARRALSGDKGVRPYWVVQDEMRGARVSKAKGAG